MAQRLAATSYNWFDPAPVDYHYPWTDLSLPWLPTEHEALEVANKMRKRGNDSFKNGDYYDALWKYEHANTLLDSFDLLTVDEEMAVLHANISASCMKLGDEGRIELLHSMEGFPIHQIMWYGYSHQHAHAAIILKPDRRIACKAFKRRGESFKKMLSFPGMQDAMKLFMPEESNPYCTIIEDYITSCELQEVPDARTYYEAILMAVDEDQTELLPPFGDPHIRCGLSSRLLKEAMSDPATTSEHLEFLLFDQEITSSLQPPFDATQLSPSTLLRRGIFVQRVYERLVDYGMAVSNEDINLAVNVLPGNRLKLFKFLVSRCVAESGSGDQDSLQKASDSATRLSKRAFLDALKDYSKSSYTKLKDEGNALFLQGDYEQALGKYFQALKYCREHKMKKEMSLIRANCAQACLKLELFSDAYTHCCECLRLDKTNHKGYYRRAEAVKALMQTTSEYGGSVEVVKDYLKCHDLQTCLEAFCQAVVLAVKHGCTHLIPKLRTSDVHSGFSNEVFRHITSRGSQLGEKLLQFMILRLPDSRIQPYNASCLELRAVLPKTTDGNVVRRLLDWGVRVDETDIMVATRCLRDNQADLYELILSRSAPHSGGRINMWINRACDEAIQRRKPNFVVALIKRGSTPPPELLVDMEGVRENQHVKDYLRMAMVHRQYHEHGSVSEDIVERVSDLGLQAKTSFKAGKLTEAMNYYQEALQMCRDFGMRDEAASIHNNIAHLHLCLKSYDMAYKHSSESIRLSGSLNSKGYFRRAEASRHAVRTKCLIPGGTSYEDAIEDYRKSYELKPELKTLAEAVTLANEINKLGHLLFECKTLSEKSCRALLQLLLSKPGCRSQLLSFLLMQAWENKKVDCSSVQLKTLLVEKKVTNPNLLQRFIEFGAVVQSGDVCLAIQNLSSDDIGVFKLIVSKCQEFDKNDACSEAAAANKILFVLHLVELGASLPEDGIKLFKEAVKLKQFEGARLLVKFFSKEALESLDLAVLLETTSLIFDVKLVETLITAGVCVTGKKSPVVVVMQSNLLDVSAKIDILSLLIERGADCKQLCQTCHKTTTPLHVATELALQTEGVVKLIEVVAASESFDKSAKLLNDKGETPLHLACKPHVKKDVSIAVLTSLVETRLLDPSVKDKAQKRPRDHIPTKDTKDPRFKLLDSATSKVNPEKKKNKKKKKKKNDNSEKKDPQPPKPAANKVPVPKIEEPTPPSEPEPPVPRETKSVTPKKGTVYKDWNVLEKIGYHFSRIKKQDDTYFLVDVQDSSFPEPSASTTPTTLHVKRATPSVLSPRHPALSPDRSSLRSNPSPSHSSDISVISDGNSELELEGLNFDCLPWEVEVTRNVVKFFRNTKKFSPTDRVNAARVIYSIAEGKRNNHLSKQVGSNQSVCLYEARVTSSSRILWDKAINFSAKLTGDTALPLYAEVIRVWEVILDHDNLDRSIKSCSEQIVQSYERGYLSAVRYPLVPMHHGVSRRGGPGEGEGQEKVRGKEVLEMPRVFTTQTLPASQRGGASKHHFVPAASTNESEYNVTTFYSFDTVTMKSMIAGGNDKRDYPFKEWQKEHEIIKLNSKEAILLLGRSGTGKTTCCLYRLWNEFKNYWNPESSTAGVKIPRKTLISASSLDSDDEYLSGSEESDSTESSDEIFEESTPVKSRTRSSDSTGPGVFVGKDQFTGLVEEDLHQVFVTKNYVLCDQMKKRFYCMAAAHDFLEPHLIYEEEPLPNAFDKLENLSYPIFITARQFYILLDNSLGGADTFFVRDAEGNLMVKISSLDYDHEDADILLDLEQSDSEDEAVEQIYTTSTTQSSAPRQHSSKWTEVTALYFKEIVWPKISQGHAKEFDPMLVWLEIQSFIKGSERAIRKGAPLTLPEYKEIGNRMAPNFSSHREVIFKLFKKYQRFVQNRRHIDYLFDECDLVMNLHQRLKKTLDVPWSIHSVYIDEVQDFTQAELSIFIHCCRDPNSMFFTGDTAQSIMRGVAFRFQDLRSCFHRINQKVPFINVPKEPLKLTINYRSHSGILKLAGSVIDLISEFFKDSIDHLPDDEGMFPGPMPIFLDSCEEKDLSLLLSTNKRECSAIEFGAHQVILVQSKEAKDRLPDILKGAIALTIFEAKGLEFDDVLLYNFFTDSLVSEKDWRVVTSYLEMPQHQRKIENQRRLPGSLPEPRSRPFDKTLHKSLNAELKYLYTAVTRAKCNLWIYDSNKKNRLPMLDYWHKRANVKIVTADGAMGQDYDLVFASNSTPEQWASQGDNFRKKHLWEQAILCYEKAGLGYAYLVKEAYAYHYIQEARQQKPQQFQSAALSFLERDELVHSVHCLNGAALCLKNSRPPRHTLAATLFERLGDLVKAAQCFLKGRDFENFARIQESQGEYDAVIKSLQGKPFMRKREALAKADEYEKKGIKLDPKFTPSELSFSCAKFYSERKDHKILLEVLRYMPEQERRVKFMKEASLFSEAFEEHVTGKQFSDAYRLASAQGWFDKAIELAKQTGDELSEGRFVIQLAKHEYLKESKDVSSVIAKLKRVASTTKDRLLRAESNLLLGMLLKSAGSCIIALGLFKLLKHKAGVVESFDQLIQFNRQCSEQEILDSCHVAKNISETLKKNISDMNIDVKQAVKLCGLQLVGRVYATSEFCNVWIAQETLAEFQCEDARYDIDGMMRVKCEVREDVIARKYKEYIQKWLDRSDIENRLNRSMQKFPLHVQLYRQRRLTKQYSTHEVSSTSMREYLQVCVHMLELLALNRSTESIITHIVAIFSPQVHMYLPRCLNDLHLQLVRRSEISRKSFTTYIETMIKRGEGEFVKIDMWLFVWRASCVALPNLKSLFDKMNALEAKVNEAEKSPKAEKERFQKPPGYIFWRSEKQYLHIFSLWLNSCNSLREKSQALWAAKLAITHFLGNIAEDRQVTISVPNAIFILTIHCTSLLAMLTHANALQGYSTTFTVPLMYKHMVQLFSHMNCRKETSDKSLLAACAEQVSSYRNLHDIHRECRMLLVKAMGYLIGTHPKAPNFSMLKYSLQGNSNSDTTRLCLIFTLTLFGNLTMLKVRELNVFSDKILSILAKTISRNKDVPYYVRRVYDEARNSPHFSRPGFVFSLVAKLLNHSQMDDTMSKLVLNKGRIEFSHYQSHQKNHHQQQQQQQQRMRTPTSAIPASKPAEKLPPAPATTSSEMSIPLSVSTRPHSELGKAPVSPPTAPIGSERRQATTSQHSATTTARSAAPGQELPSSYLPGFPRSVSHQPAQSEVHFAPNTQEYNPMGRAPEPPFMGAIGRDPFSALLGPSESTSSVMSSDPFKPLPDPFKPVSDTFKPVPDPFKPVSDPFKPVPSASAAFKTTPSAGTESSGSTLTPFAAEFVPSVTPPMASTELAPHLNQTVDPGSMLAAAYNFQDEQFYYMEQPEQPDEAGMAPYNYDNDGYFLTQQSQPFVPATPIDPELIGEDIIDEDNFFCNVCNVTYELQNNVSESAIMEAFHTHVTGAPHRSNTVAYKRFKLATGELTESDSGISFRLIDFAESKLCECQEMRASVESEPLDKLVDALKDQIYKYNLTVSKFDDNRRWEEGEKVVTSMNEKINSLLKEAHEHLHKLAEFSRQKSLQRAALMEDEEEMEEIEKLSEKTLEREERKPGSRGGARQGAGTIKTMQEKEESRNRKRSKKSSKDH